MSSVAPHAANGLVHTSTSVTRLPLDPLRTRNLRKKVSTITSARLLQEQMQKGGQRYRVVLVTLTYARCGEWEPKHITEYVRRVREFLRRRRWAMRYVWVAELQKRGAVHYHVLIWLPRGITLPFADKVAWWRHGQSQQEWARNAVGYLAIYASKPDTKGLPRGCRICASGGLDQQRAMERRWWMSPGWIRKEFDIDDDMRPCKGGGWVSRVTGEWCRSPWEFCFIDGKPYVRRVSRSCSDAIR